MCPTEAAEKMICMMPAMEQEIHRAADKSTFELVHVFTDTIKKMVTEIPSGPADRALALMDELYSTGDPHLKLAVENVFVFSLETMAAQSHDAEFWTRLPPNLYHAYVKQVYRSNI